MVKAMSKHVSSTVLKHSKVEDVFQDRGNFYVLVSIDLADLQSFGGQNLNKAVAKINRFTLVTQDQKLIEYVI